MYPEDLNSPRRELSNGGLGFILALLIRPGIDLSCVSTGGPIQLYRPSRVFCVYNTVLPCACMVYVWGQLIIFFYFHVLCLVWHAIKRYG